MIAASDQDLVLTPQVYRQLDNRLRNTIMELEAIREEYLLPLIERENAASSPPTMEKAITEVQLDVADTESTPQAMQVFLQHHQLGIPDGRVAPDSLFITLRMECPCLLCELMRVQGVTSITLIYPKKG